METKRRLGASAAGGTSSRLGQSQDHNWPAEISRRTRKAGQLGAPAPRSARTESDLETEYLARDKVVDDEGGRRVASPWPSLAAPTRGGAAIRPLGRGPSFTGRRAAHVSRLSNGKRARRTRRRWLAARIDLFGFNLRRGRKWCNSEQGQARYMTRESRVSSADSRQQAAPVIASSGLGYRRIGWPIQASGRATVCAPSLATCEGRRRIAADDLIKGRPQCDRVSD